MKSSSIGDKDTLSIIIEQVFHFFLVYFLHSLKIFSLFSIHIRETMNLKCSLKEVWHSPSHVESMTIRIRTNPLTLSIILTNGKRTIFLIR